ncbi:hypothetical protein [Phreatobacter cathodiphilus]|uniref:Uncharacterized protein n=1 Tax=Phreatobacter cathodiphilus TaxID=1868589 RepID=A0A2S0NGL2_9HYPH|nr:hypothetical protein [Phreatobacter cathodiphilus]AVO47309.1 hypothetical protein C6569_20935 [Phreatobacter cathodiphilus]
MVARGGRRLAAQVVVSVFATACAAVAVPKMLATLSPAPAAAPQEKAVLVSRPATPVDFDAAFVWPTQAPAARAEDLVPPAAPLPAVVPVPPVRRAQQVQQVQQAQRGCAPRCPPVRPAAPAAASPPGEPLQLVAMTATAAPAPSPARRSVFGIPLPRLPYEETVTGSLVRARDTLRSLF